MQRSISEVFNSIDSVILEHSHFVFFSYIPFGKGSFVMQHNDVLKKEIVINIELFIDMLHNISKHNEIIRIFRNFWQS